MGTSTVDKWNNDGSANGPRHDAVNPGPENTAYDQARHGKMRLRSQRYGFFKVATDPTEDLKCCKCQGIILFDGLIIDGRSYHGKCFRPTA